MTRCRDAFRALLTVCDGAFYETSEKLKASIVDVCQGPKYTSDMIIVTANSESTVNYIPLGEFSFLQSPLI